MPVKNEALKIICKGSDRALLRILTIETGILEGPTALPIFRFDISVQTDYYTTDRYTDITLDGRVLSPSKVSVVVHITLNAPLRASSANKELFTSLRRSSTKVVASQVCL